MKKRHFSWNKHSLSNLWKWLISPFCNKTGYHNDPIFINYCRKLMNFTVVLINFLSPQTKIITDHAHVPRILKFKIKESTSVPAVTKHLSLKDHVESAVATEETSQTWLTSAHLSAQIGDSEPCYKQCWDYKPDPSNQDWFQEILGQFTCFKKCSEHFGQHLSIHGELKIEENSTSLEIIQCFPKVFLYMMHVYLPSNYK